VLEVRAMNWNIDIRDLNKRQVFWLVVGILIFGGLMFTVAFYDNRFIMFLICVVVYFGARWYLAGKEIEHDAKRRR
jgi:hypothetical protein